jgi:sortase A
LITETTTRRSAVAALAVRSFGWLLLTAGAVLLLYLVWLLWFTGFETRVEQQKILGEFEGFGVAQTDGSLLGGQGADNPTIADGDLDGDGNPLDGSALAVIEFERPGSDKPPVTDVPLGVVEGTSLAALTRGPGHYASTALPGQTGNFAIAGHRTTNDAPFYNLDQLVPGDLVHVTDRAGERFTYAVLDETRGGGAPGQNIVLPTETWVLDRDPIGIGAPLMTMSTCHPRFSATYRLVIFAELVS